MERRYAPSHHLEVSPRAGSGVGGVQVEDLLRGGGIAEGYECKRGAGGGHEGVMSYHPAFPHQPLFCFGIG